MEVFNLYLKYLNLFLESSWLWSPFVLAAIFFHSWMYYIQRYYWRELEWIMLEVKPPREIESSPKNMEQVFAGLWAAFGNVGHKYIKYIKGAMQDYYSFELVGTNGEAHFYLRVLKKFRDFVEAQIYSQYPQAEIREVEDYTKRVPLDVPSKKWNLWGARLVLGRPDAYPLRTYVSLMDVAKTDQPFFDPLAGLMEAFGKLREGEQIWIQILFRPVPDDEAIRLRQEAFKLIGKKMPPPQENIIKTEARTWGQALYGVGYELLQNQVAPEKKVERIDQFPSLAQFLSPGEKDVVAGIEEKTAKKLFEAKVSFVYLAKSQLFTMANVSATMGIIAQFANLNMNYLKPDPRLTTRAFYLFAKARKAFKQRKLMRLMRLRTFWEKGYLLNIEELATLFHFPTLSVRGPMTPYIEVKKGSAPVDLPLE